MKMSKVGNQTNSQDPQAVNSRVFVGNLNTFQCSKTDVERMFQRYGRLVGISMHKGYAFVQFTNPFDARSACLGEDGRTILSQVLDVNMVAEPKPHQTGRKRQNVNATGNDWDYYYDSYYASAALPSLVPLSRTGPPAKRPRLMPTIARTPKLSPSPTHVEKTANNSTNSDYFKKYSNPDILICGNCRELFTEIHELLEHKKTYCKLRFTCKCRPTPLNGFCDNYKLPNDSDHSTYASLLCVQCKESFPTAWDLMVHVQATHSLNIYTVRASSSSPSPQEADAASATDLPLSGLSPNLPTLPDSDKDGDSNSRQSSINDNGNEEMLVFQLLPNSQIKFKNIPEKTGILYEGISK